MKQFIKEKILPLSLTAFVLLVDQISKAFIAGKWVFDPDFPSKYRYDPIAQVFGNDFLQIIHVRNPAIAFSMGNSLPEMIKPVLFIIVPILVLIFLIAYYFRSSEFTWIQRWAAAGIIGGGFGNLIDRVFRPDGVVDFIDVKFYGIFGWERWPTFNAADSAVVVCCIILFTTMLFTFKKKEKDEKKVKEEMEEKKEIVEMEEKESPKEYPNE